LLLQQAAFFPSTSLSYVTFLANRFVTFLKRYFDLVKVFCELCNFISVTATQDSPKFRTVGRNLVLEPTVQANAVEAANNRSSRPVFALSPDEVERQARDFLFNAGKPVTPDLLATYSAIQFGKFRGQTFKWILENAVGWAVGFLKSYSKETVSGAINSSHLAVNKRQFWQYAMGFPPVVDAVNFSKLVEDATKKVAETGDEGHRLLEFGEFRDMTWHGMVTSTDPKHQRYVTNFIMPKVDCRKGTRMELFRNYCISMRKETSKTTG
jgi:hypothetical protein